MPNHVKNIIKLTGAQNEIDYIVNLITNTEEVDGEIQNVVDFNSLIPMPETLNVLSGGCSDECLLIYLRDTFDTKTIDVKNEHLRIIKDYNSRQVWNYKSVDLDKMPSSEELYGKIQTLVNKYSPQEKNPYGDNPVFEKHEDVINYGKQIYENIRDYDCKDWYDWRVEHWGTKWNSYGNEQDVMPNCTKLKFETAWDIPFNFYVKLYEVIHRDCKSLSCNIKYANEDYGSGLGEISDINGDKVRMLDYLEEYKDDWDTLEEIAEEIWEE
jgi:hypothetical protein